MHCKVFYRVACVSHGYSYGKASNAGLESMHVYMNVYNFWADISLSMTHPFSLPQL